MYRMWEEILEQPYVLKECLATKHGFISHVAADIVKRDIQSVIIAARGTSDHAAAYGKYIIEYLLGVPVTLAAPSILTIYKGTLLMKKSLVIGISQSGQAQDVLEIVKCANNQKALTISITNNSASPLAKAVDYHLFADAGTERSVAATKTFTTQMLLIALLVASWSKDDQIYNALMRMPGELKSVLALETQVKMGVQTYRHMEHAFVLARGINYPIALECALKIQETCYVKAMGYAASDFHHGPFAMIENGTPVIVFAPSGPTHKDMIVMISKLKKTGASVILVTDDMAIRKRADLIFKIPKGYNDVVSPFYNVTWAQMFACQLAAAKGLNPDMPRGLSKVTITR